MIKALVSPVLAACLASLGVTAEAAPITYTISGVGSGLLNDTNFTDADFVFSLTGDSANFLDEGFGPEVDPLIDATATIAGFGTMTFLVPTRIGINGTGVYFGNSAVLNPYASQADLFDFHLASPLNLYGAFGPVLGTGVFALNQFQFVPTSAGYLWFNASSDVLFSSTGTPEPASWALMIIGFGLTGTSLRRREEEAASRS